MSEEYIKGVLYRVTLEGEWDGHRLDVRESTPGNPGCALYDNTLSAAVSIEKIADPIPEWFPGDKVLRSTSVAVYQGNDSWEVLYNHGVTRSRHSDTVLSDYEVALVKQGKRVVS